MKYLLIFLILFSYQTQAQQENALFLPLDEVENPPAFPGCENEEFTSCSLSRITSFFMGNIDPGLLFSLEESESYLNLRFIVDTSGKVRRPMAVTKNEKLQKAANKVLSTLPDFKPGMHNNRPVNVIVEVPTKLTPGYPSGAENNSYPIGEEAIENTSSPSKISPIAIACEKNVQPARCTTSWVQEFVQKNFDLDRMKGKKGFLKVMVKFVINEDGKVTNVTAEGEDERMKKEAIKAVEKLPDFIPAMQEGKKISYDYNLPITISINKSR